MAFFANKVIKKGNFTLVGNENTLLNSLKISKTSNVLFSDIVKNFGISQYEDPTIDNVNISDPLYEALADDKNHLCARPIKNTLKR